MNEKTTRIEIEKLRSRRELCTDIQEELNEKLRGRVQGEVQVVWRKVNSATEEAVTGVWHCRYRLGKERCSKME